MTGATLQAIRYQRGSLDIIDQLLLPHETLYIPISTLALGHDAIKTMKVRGAPAIAIVAALTLAVVLVDAATAPRLTSAQDAVAFIEESLEFLKTSRPTAVNLFDAAHKLAKGVREAAVSATSGQEIVNKYLELSERMLEEDVKDNMNIGHFGAEYILNAWKGGEDLRVITHCNTGSLATAGYGTALGIIRALAGQKKLTHAYCTETRPYNQGSRLTAYELVYENIPSTLITDSMASALLAQNAGKIAAIVVGADPPSTSVDLNIDSGKEIHIEARPAVEVTTLRGPVVEAPSSAFKKDATGAVVSETIAVAARGIGVWNPSFDVTPAELISAIVTEKGVVLKGDGQQFDMRTFLSSN
ncbi:S-methyl-5-thioribose-1-phosphate isomerase [Podila horticola]|nr:S-methyl-5-thioribose-1-phosphate isomerase [Podila horticola]